MSSSIMRNIALASLRRLSRLGLHPRSAAERGFATDWAVKLQIKYGRLSNPVSSLSGGNQQKVVLAKWLARRPSLLIVDEPTRGIDVGTKAEVHRLLDELAAEGVAILMISSELPEVLRLADRDPRDARGPARRRVRPRRRVRGDDRRRGDRPGRGGCVSMTRRAPTPRRRRSPANPRRLVDLVFRIRAFGIIAVLALLVLVTAIIQPRFLSAQELQFVLERHDRVRAARGRRDDGRADAQRRPLGRLGARALGLPLGRPVRQASRDPRSSLVFVVGHGDRHRLRDRQRVPDHDRPCAEPGRDARDALHHPRHRHPRRRRRPGRRQLAAELVPEHPAGDDRSGFPISRS